MVRSFFLKILDPKVFKRFKPNKAIVKNMNLSAFVLSSNTKDADLALDFCAFLLRYHREIDYSDFSDDQYVVGRIRRSEVFRAWADIEDLALGYERLMNNLHNHQKTASSAFKELRNYCDTILSN
jgi:hypothetical protein